VVVRGTARVTIGDKVQMLRENESVYVPSGAPHRLEIPARSISRDRQLSR
jgi:mannose-6-phosphate isomerase-like protein (cupin superfamily)